MPRSLLTGREVIATTNRATLRRRLLVLDVKRPLPSITLQLNMDLSYTLSLAGSVT